MELQIGSTIGDYQVLGVLGAGGMGSVYQVRNLISDRVEALKILLPDLSGQPELAERFQREIKVQGSLEHPNIAQLRTAFRSGNQLLMVMEFVDGITLETLLRDHGPLAVPQALDAMSQVLSALEYAHGRGVIHRDIKPANMILTRAGVVKLMDFGIAKAATDHKLTMTGTTMGSIYYMSPEQIQGATDLDARADLYSVGVTLYQLVTGKRPFDGDSQYAIMAAHLQTSPVPPVQIDPALPQALNDVILMSVAKDPNGRFQTAAAFRNALGGVASTLPAGARSAPLFPQAAPQSPINQPPPVQMPTMPPVAGQSPYIPPTTPLAAQTPTPQYIPPTTPLAVPPANAQYIPPTTPLAVPQPNAQYIPPTTPLATPAGQGMQGGFGGPPAPPKSKRGLWMALGGVAAVAVIVAAIEFVPWKGVKADSAKTIAPNAQTQVALQPSPTPSPTAVPDAGTPAPVEVLATALPTPAGTTPPPNPKGVHPQPTSRPTPVQDAILRPTPTPPPQATPIPTPVQVISQPHPEPKQPAGPSREEIMRAREHVVKLRVRADLIRSSLQGLKRSQQSQGMNLNAKYTGPEGLMNQYMKAADDALAANDLTVAREFADKAEHQIEILEKLLNL